MFTAALLLLRLQCRLVLVFGCERALARQRVIESFEIRGASVVSVAPAYAQRHSHIVISFGRIIIAYMVYMYTALVFLAIRRLVCMLSCPPRTKHHRLMHPHNTHPHNLSFIGQLYGGELHNELGHEQMQPDRKTSRNNTQWVM